ncbi:MAG: hypothetical protein AB3N06_09295 [Erythrobacter sp.]
MTILEAITPTAWMWGTALTGAAILAAFGPTLRKRFLRWRRDRRFAKPEAIRVAEYRELSHSIDESEQTVTLAPFVLGVVLLWTALILGDLGFRFLIEAALGLFAIGGFVYSDWRKLNDPPEVSDGEDAITIDGTAYPRESLVGFAFAVALVVFVLVMIAFYF